MRQFASNDGSWHEHLPDLEDKLGISINPNYHFGGSGYVSDNIIADYRGTIDFGEFRKSAGFLFYESKLYGVVLELDDFEDIEKSILKLINSKKDFKKVDERRVIWKRGETKYSDGESFDAYYKTQWFNKT